MERQLIDPKIDVTGEAVGAVVDSFRLYPIVVQKYLTKHGLTTSKQAQIDRSAWYPLENWLATYQSISQEIGLSSLYSIGKKIPENANLPPSIKDVRSALTGIDVGYHLNHRKNGVVMFNVVTGQMLEGIGHYHCELMNGEQRAIMTCENPYPCDLDRGIITGFAMRFAPTIMVVHSGNSCRKKGASNCTYTVSW